jgi:hypothetical protein
MTIVEKINSSAKKLPPNYQDEVLDFIEFLLHKTSTKPEDEEELNWFDFSLANAVRDIDDKAEPLYTKADLKEKWL